MTSHWKALVGVFLIFVLGCFFGGVATSIFFHHRMVVFLKNPNGALSAALEKRLTGNLDLDENQKQQIHECFEENMKRRKELQKRIQPQGRTINQQTIRRIDALLRPDQARIFHQNVEGFRKRLGAMSYNRDAENVFSSPAQDTDSSTNSAAGSPPAQQ
jgi:hypothetical protein